MKLYELTDQYNTFLERIDDFDEETFKDTLEGLQGDISVKAENMAKMVKCIEADITAFKIEADRLTARKTTLENRKNSIKKYLQDQLTLVNMKKVKAGLFTVSIQKNPAHAKIVDEDLFKVDVKEYLKYPAPTIDKTRLLKDLKAGLDVKGAYLEQTESIRIR